MWDVKLGYTSDDPQAGEIMEDWFVVKESQIRNSGLGLYADHSFKVDDAVGVYLGLVKEKKKCGSEYAMCAKFGNIDPGHGIISEGGRHHGGD